MRFFPILKGDCFIVYCQDKNWYSDFQVCNECTEIKQYSVLGVIQSLSVATGRPIETSSSPSAFRILRESCDVGSKVCTGTLKESCDKGFQKTLEEEKMQPDLVLNLSKVERCEMHISTYLAEEIPAGFPAFVAQGDNVSRWKLGADRPSKFGWIANEEPRYWKKRRKSEHWPELSQYGRYAQLLPGPETSLDTS